MSRLNGFLYICDRCGKDKFSVRDGTFVTAPEGWVSYSDTSMICRGIRLNRELTLCPECEKLYQELLDDFFGVDKGDSECITD